MKIREWTILCLAGLVSWQVSAQSNMHNYIELNVFLNETESQVLKTIKYYDGLGKETQTVQKNITTSGDDLVSRIEYDAIGRASKKWMPLPFANNNGGFVRENRWASQSADEPFTKIEYETSPLNRIVRSWGVGREWHEDKGIEQKQLCNNTASAHLSVRRYVLNGDKLESKGYYASGDLFAKYTNDEDGRESYVFTDKMGNLILSRQLSEEGGIDTYHIYDERNRLRMVLPPMTMDDSEFMGTRQKKALDRYAYVYGYDLKNRCVSKKLPGCAEIKMAYDIHGNLIFREDGKLRGKKMVEFYRYDKFNRMIMCGYMSQPNGINAEAYSSLVMHESYDGSGDLYGYSDTRGMNIRKEDIQEVYYYDDHDFLGLFDGAFAYRGKDGYGARYINPASSHSSTKGLQTGYVKKVIGSSKILLTALYHDQKGRVVQSHSNNDLGGYDSYFYKYDFTGSVLLKSHEHKSSSVDMHETYSYSYDTTGRLKESNHQIDWPSSNSRSHLLARNSYDEYGRLAEKFYTDTCKTTYEYNIRNQLSSICFSGLYNQKYQFSKGGNITSTQWQNGDADFKHAYTYTYDKLNRLKKADHTANDEHIPSPEDQYQKYDGNPIYTVSYEYDKHGNIMHLNRIGCTGISNVRFQDNLHYQYDGNQQVFMENLESNYVQSLEDASWDFIECFYDQNGNLIQDNNRYLNRIDYNFLNLPERIQYDRQMNGKVIEYTYSSDGTRLKARYATGTSDMLSPVGAVANGDATDIIYNDSIAYCDNFVYRNGKLTEILLPEGYIKITYHPILKDKIIPEYFFYVKDHLGNVRMSISERHLNGEVSYRDYSAQSYYPFGGSMKNWNSYVPKMRLPLNKYNGKEEEQTHNLGWYNYGKRFYDPNYRLGFISIDPLCEKYYSMSPYAYCGNNPINNIDLNGDSISMIRVMIYDDISKTNHTQTTTTDLQSQTGLTLNMSTTGQMTYAKDANGNPIVATNESADGKMAEVGSATARSHLIGLIDNQETINIEIAAGKRSQTVGYDIALDPQQINSFIDGSVNVDNRTLGWGMTFLHESYHTPIGGDLRDTPGNRGPVVTNMNVIRSELNTLGGNYGERQSYPSYLIGKNLYLPFNRGASLANDLGLPPLPINKYIKF